MGNHDAFCRDHQRGKVLAGRDPPYLGDSREACWVAVEDPPLEKPRHHNADGSRAKRAREISNTRSICPVELIVCSGPLRIPRLLVTVSSEVQC